MHIRADDQVQVMVGRDKGLRAKVQRVMREEGKVVVEGVNLVWKHMRRSQKNPRGGRLHKEMPVKLATIQLICPACGQPARTGARFKADGSKHRYCKKCGAETGQISPAKKRRAALQAAAKR